MTEAPLPAGSHVAVIGGGIIGLTACFTLLERGYRVTLFERDEPGLTGPSFGNAGHVVGSAVEPLATPGIAVAGLRMLRSPDGPLKIPRAYLGRVAPWLYRFWRSSYGERYAAAQRALAAMSRGAVDDFEALVRRAGPAVAATFRREPCLYLYESAASHRAALTAWRLCDRLGMGVSQVGVDEIRALEPQLAPIFTHGVLSHDWGIVSDPYAVSRTLFAALHRDGFDHRRAEVAGPLPGPGDVTLRTAEGDFRVDAALVAAGVWSVPLARQVGDTLPVEAERGYNLTYGSHDRVLQRPLVFADRGVVATQLSVGLRLGGWTELGGTELPPEPAHWQAMRRIADTVLPGLRGAEARQWMGHRPSTPDTVPVVSRSARHPRVFYAVGHGHYGLSFSARTAAMIAGIIADAADADHVAYSIRRFA